MPLTIINQLAMEDWKINKFLNIYSPAPITRQWQVKP